MIMIPTLFGVTVVSFCIMQLAPGDPLLAQGGERRTRWPKAAKTRDAYLIQKRDLKLDKPLILNFQLVSRLFGQGLRCGGPLHGRCQTCRKRLPPSCPTLADKPDSAEVKSAAESS